MRERDPERYRERGIRGTELRGANVQGSGDRDVDSEGPSFRDPGDLFFLFSLFALFALLMSVN